MWGRSKAALKLSLSHGGPTPQNVLFHFNLSRIWRPDISWHPHRETFQNKLEWDTGLSNTKLLYFPFGFPLLCLCMFFPSLSHPSLIYCSSLPGGNSLCLFTSQCGNSAQHAFWPKWRMYVNSILLALWLCSPPILFFLLLHLVHPVMTLCVYSGHH